MPYHGTICGGGYETEEEVQKLEAEHIPCELNSMADTLSRIASQRGLVPPGIFIEVLHKPSILADKLKAVVASSSETAAATPTEPSQLDGAVPVPGNEASAKPNYVEALPVEKATPSWAVELVDHLQNRILPEDDVNAERVAHQDKMYTIIDGEIYQKRENGVRLRCISQEEGLQILSEIHEGTCSNHVASRALVGKVYRMGFFWPTALTDAEKLVKTCADCQFHAKSIHQPAQALQTILISWPFAVLGLDIVGKLPRAAGGYEYLFVAINKFTKWAEMEPVRNITAQDAIKFMK